MIEDGTRPETPEAAQRQKDRREKDEVTTVEIKVGAEMEDEHGDHYTILEKLGEGGMGGVFRVRDERTGLERAVKFMNSRHRQDQMYIRHFQKEIEALVKLKNPFILFPEHLTYFQIGGERVPGFFTELVEGPTLQKEIQTRGTIEPKQLSILAGQMAFGLEALRRAGIVHRDIKPANIFLQVQPNGEQFVRIGDFGIVSDGEQPMGPEGSSTSGDLVTQDRLTKVGYIVGTPAFMSPEAVGGKAVDHRSDLYSLGIVLYQMATGRLPFSGEDTLRQQLMDDPKPFADLGITEEPKWLEHIVMKLLEKDPEDRYQSAIEVFQAFKDKVAKTYPEALNEIPFMWDIKSPQSQSYDDTFLPIAA
ncbi:serine/threonine protein kinase [Candidatus Uhrbacteria bacterium]|nr:serine/threonine protein kinase [Candidatus Uhrbacteria bacterium]